MRVLFMSDEREYFNLVFFAAFVKVAYIVCFFSEARVAPSHPSRPRGYDIVIRVYTYHYCVYK